LIDNSGALPERLEPGDRFSPANLRAQVELPATAIRGVREGSLMQLEADIGVVP